MKTVLVKSTAETKTTLNCSENVHVIIPNNYKKIKQQYANFKYLINIPNITFR